MRLESRFHWWARLVIVVVGVLVLAIGLVARSLEEESGPGGEWQERGDGTVAIYDFVEAESQYEFRDIDESTAVVYQYEAETRREVFRGTPEEARAWFESQTRVLVFEGSREDAAGWDQERREASDDMLTPNLLTAAGAVVIVGGLLLGWHHKRDMSTMIEPKR